MILPQQNLFFQLDRHLYAEYEDRELKCLDEYKINNILAFSFYHKIIDKKSRINNFNSVDLIFDILFISQDIKFLTGLLFLLRPFINIPSEEGGTYFQNRYDARYLPFASLAHQNVYNFWDRIGDLLYFFFDTGLEERKVYFTTVMSNFPSKYRSSEYFIKLNDLYEQKIKSLITARTQIVHYKQVETKHYLGTFQNYKNQLIKDDLEKEKKGYPEYFKNHLDYCNTGFEYALKLINELPDKPE